MAGRFAPSPTGELHLGNLRTAVIAWLAARSEGLDFFVRVEDLDLQQSSVDSERQQIGDLVALGLDWDGEIVRQSERFHLYRAEIDRLVAEGRVYECYCSRRQIRAEIEAATRAPHVHLPDGAYPGSCRDLTDAQRAESAATGRKPALRLRTHGEVFTVDDRIAGEYTGSVDDVVLARSDGVPAYNLAVVVDDSAQGVTQVVRGDDLLSSTPRQMLLQQLLGLPTPTYLHVPLVFGDIGHRLAKRDGAVTLSDLAADGWGPDEVLGALARSLGLAGRSERVRLHQLVDRFDPASLPHSPVLLSELHGLLVRP